MSSSVRKCFPKETGDNGETNVHLALFKDHESTTNSANVVQTLTVLYTCVIESHSSALVDGRAAAVLKGGHSLFVHACVFLYTWAFAGAPSHSHTQKISVCDLFWKQRRKEPCFTGRYTHTHDVHLIHTHRNYLCATFF